MQKKVLFLREALKNIKTAGTVVPSSKFLVKRILNKVDFETAKVIVEYGPGNGIITHEILKKLNPEATLICFEVNETFYKELKKINNPQLVILNVSAEKIDSEIKKLGFNQVCHYISSLPLAIIPKEVSQSIIQKSKTVLKDQGKFIQFQYSTQFLKQFKIIFDKKIDLDFEPLNIPPALIYICEK